MKVTSKSWQADASDTALRSPAVREDGAKTEDTSKTTDKDTLDRTDKSALGFHTDEEDSDFKMHSSGPKDSVGQLAAELARAETRLDVQQVSSKATRALIDLKMAAYCGEGDEAKKARQMIRRMEKLIKRIQKKLKHLSKEEQLEIQKKRAQKQQQAEKVKEIREELRSRRRKRRRDERNYAMKELSEDGRSSPGETAASMMAAAGITTGSYGLSALAGAEGMDTASMGGEMGSVDITV